MNEEIFAFNVGCRLKEVREERKVSQESLAHQCNTDASYIRKIESARIRVSMHRLARITEVLEISLSDFLSPLSLDTADYEVDEEE